MGSIAKRFVNLVAIVCTLYLLLLVGIMAMGGVSDWPTFLSWNFGMVTLGYGFVVAINYLLFGTVTLWHRSTNKPDVPASN